ncbi:hypothetical protein U1Q18_026798 [Sarracenia purpurea var. burkii]
MSIDEDLTEEHCSGPNQPQRHHIHNKHIDQSKPSAWQQPTSVTFPTRRSRESSVYKDEEGKESDGAVEKETKEEGSENQNESPQTSQASHQSTRRLSVQDRINMFESKQKENSGSGSGSGGKPVVGKSVELKRMSSDVSAAPLVVEKAVLRRWSGASDMSIELTGEKKDVESPLCTPSSVSQTKSEDQKPLNGAPIADGGLENQAVPQIQAGVTSGKAGAADTMVGMNPGVPVMVSSGGLDASESNKLTSTLERVGSDGWKDQTLGKNRSRSSSSRAEDESMMDQVMSQTLLKSFPGGRAEHTGLIDQRRLKGSFAGDDHGGAKGLFASKKQSAESYQFPQSQSRDRGEGVGSRGHLVSQLRGPSKTTVDSGQFDDGSGLKVREGSAGELNGIGGDSLASQFLWETLGEIEEGGKKDGGGSSEKRPGNFTTKVEDSGPQRMKFQKQVSAPEHMKKSQARRDENNSDYKNNGNNRPVFSGKKVSEGQVDFGLVPTVSREQVQRVRQSKGNQELNDELKMKASELEKLFAEHKLRIPGEQSSSAWRNNPTDVQIEQETSLPYRKLPTEISPAQLPDKNMVTEISPAQLPDKNMVTEPSKSSRNMPTFGGTPPMKVLDNQDHGDAWMQNFSELGLSDDSRGKSYEKYMQKRNAKLREEWGSKRAEKEAKMKAMQDCFDRSKAEMKAKFSGSADRQDSALSTRQRAERLRSFNTRSTTKREQHPIDLLQSEDEEDVSDFAEQKSFGHDRSETSLGTVTSKSSQTKKLLPSKNFPSSAPRTPAAPVPRSAIKASNSSTWRRRMQSENPLAQSVPNFSDLRKENTKPSSGVGKSTSRPQARNYARSKSSSEEIPLGKEEKSRRSQSLRKSSASPAEFNDFSPLDSEGIVLTPLKFDKEQTEHGLYDKFSKNVESKPFLRKGSGIGPGAGAVVAKMKASLASEIVNNEEESDDLVFDPEESLDVTKDDEEDESEAMITEDQATMDNGKPRLSNEFDKLVNSGSESGDTLRTSSHADPSFVAELPAAVPSTFQPVGSVQHSPAESPVSWNSASQHAFSYAHETSDIDASVDSPIGSPDQAEADEARMRKKWGSAQKPILVSNSSHNHSRKDMTKGFKRLLKFGRRSRGTESLVDWISATTSEGDDDTEDGRDPANRSSEDLRKSRMGLSLGHPSDDSFNESEFFNEHVQALQSSVTAPPVNFRLRDDHLSGSSIKAPRSFFSLSSFRSKGSESKPR